MARKSVGGLSIDLELNTAKLVKGVDNVNFTLAKLGKTINRTFQLIGTSAAVYGLERLHEQVVALAQEGDRLGDVRDAFERLGGTATEIEKAKNALLGTVSSTDLMIQANKGLMKTIPGFSENFGKIVELGARYAQSMGKDAKEGVEQFISTLVKGKPAQLAQYGIFVTATDAATKYKQVYEQLPGAIERLAPVQDSLADSSAALGVSYKELRERVGDIINTNPELIRTYRELNNAFTEVDYRAIAEALIGIERALLAVMSAAKGVADNIMWLTDPTGIKQGAKYVKNWVLEWAKGTGPGGRGERAMAETISEIKKESQGAAPALEQAAKGAANLKGSLEDMDKAGARAVDKLADMRRELEGKSISDSLDDAVDSLNKVSFDDFLAKFKESVRAGVLAGYEGASPDVIAQARVLADQKAEIEADAWTEKWDEAVKKGGEELLQEHKKAVEGWQRFFENAITGEKFNLEDMFKQLAVGFAAELAASLSGELAGLDFSSPQKLGGDIASKLLQGAFSGEGGGFSLEGLLGSLFGNSNANVGPLANGQDYANALSGANGLLSTEAGGLFQGAGGAGAYLSALMMSMDQLSKIGQSTTGTVKGISTGVGAALGAYFGGPFGAQLGAALGKALGKGINHTFGLGGPTNKETLARMSFETQMEDRFKAIGGLNFFRGGELVNTKNLELGASNQFNRKGWADEMLNWSEKGRGAFDALGKALQRVLGISEDVGGQLGFILGKQLGGDLDNARLLVAQLGLSFEDLKGALLESAIQGEIRWAEFNSTVAGLGEAFKPGLEAFGAFDVAFERLIDSGGRGMTAVLEFKNVAVEAMEKGLTTFDELRAALIEKGADPAYVDAMFESLRQKGVETLEEWAQLSDEQAGTIVGNMEALNKALAETWQQMGQNIDELNKKLEEIPEKVESSIDIELNLPENWGELDKLNSLNGGSVSVKHSAAGNVFTTPTLSLMGEAGPEAILPLRRINGRLGVSAIGSGGGLRQTVIHVDARGAEIGVEQLIESRLRGLKEDILQSATAAVAREYGKGGSYRHEFS